jgi:hypothetical protein
MGLGLSCHNAPAVVDDALRQRPPVGADGLEQVPPRRPVENALNAAYRPEGGSYAVR